MPVKQYGVVSDSSRFMASSGEGGDEVFAVG